MVIEGGDLDDLLVALDATLEQLRPSALSSDDPGCPDCAGPVQRDGVGLACRSAKCGWYKDALASKPGSGT